MIATTNLGLTPISSGQAQKEVTANENFDILAGAIAESITLAMADTDVTLTTVQATQNATFICTGANTADRNLIVPAGVIRLYDVKNSTTGGHNVIVKTPSGTGVALAGAVEQIVRCDGTNVVAVTAPSTAGAPGGTLQAANNLSDVASASAARTNLGLGSMATQAASAVAITGGSITGLTTPTNPSDAATKAYVDGAAAGLSVRDPCAAATVAVLPNSPTYNNGASGVGATLTAGSNGALTVDGYTVVVNDRVLVKNQAAGAQNGLYSVTATGDASHPYTLTRTADANSASNIVPNLFTFIKGGSTNAAASFVLSTTGAITVGTTALTFSQFASAGSYTAGSGITLTGSTFSITGNGVTNALLAQMPAHTFKGNNTGALANASDLTATQLTAELNVVVGDGGSGGTKGLVPAANAGDAASNKFLKADGTFATAGYINIPQNSQSTNYTTLLSDQGKHLLHPAADTTPRTFTIDSNANVAFPIGTAITFVNQNGAGVLTIAIASDIMRLAGSGATGSRTLAPNGVATAIKIATTEWIISGTSLT